MTRIVSSTYRLQLHKGFTFDDAAAVAAYLKALGISHVYSSPYLQAAPGSMHGYDVVDPQSANGELGGAEGHARLCRRFGEVGLGQVLDIVPNHMALGPQNRYWWDVIENGPSSRYATWFDIDWNSAEAKLHNKVLIPVLGDQYGRVLSARQSRWSTRASASSCATRTTCFRSRRVPWPPALKGRGVCSQRHAALHCGQLSAPAFAGDRATVLRPARGIATRSSSTACCGSYATSSPR